MAPESSSRVPRGYRFQASLPAVLLEGDREHSCAALDLSRTGVLLVGEVPSPEGKEVEFSIRSVSGDVQQRFIGRVARIETAGEEGGALRSAVEFLALDLDQKQSLEVLLARVMEGRIPAVLEALRPGAPPQEVRKALESIALAHRIALASRAGPREREFLRQDPHPLALESLARNPNLLAAEARALAGVIHLLTSTLEILASDPRWARDEDIQIAIATHPNVSIPLAERVAAQIDRSALRKMLARPSLHPLIRDKILRRLARG
jgi:hypothetical protein